MYRSPNSEIRNYKDKSIYPYRKGNNQIYRTFGKAINILLSKEYYEGSYLGMYYNQFTEDEEGNYISTTYVKQPEIEGIINDEIINNDADMVKYLVGYEGVGKTTLIRNIFHVFDRKPNVFKDNLVIYISFYQSGFAAINTPEKIVRDIVCGSIEMAITFLSGYNTVVERITSYNDDFYKSFASYLNDNNVLLAHYSAANPSAYNNVKNADNPIIEYLNRIYETDPIDYNVTLLKYYLSKTENRKYKNVYFIFDDLETLPIDYIDEIFNMSMHLDKCTKGLVGRKYNVKQIIALRSYTFKQSKFIKQFSAYKISNNDIIIKNQVPFLTEILAKRISSIKNTLEIKKADNGIDETTQLKIYGLWDDLNAILNDTYAKYDSLLLNLTQFNIFNSLQLLVRIITNHKYFGKKEIEDKGSFSFDKAIYDLDNNNRNSDIFFALAYGENELYFDSNDYYLMNIMHYHIEDKQDTELLGIYIIQYMMHNKMALLPDYYHSISKKGNITIIHYDDCNVIEGDKLLHNLSSFYSLADRKEFINIKEGFKAMLEHLYNGGALLQDIKKPVIDDGNAYGRRYEHGRGVRVYLSLRGYQLYKMLHDNALLLQVYRDDIDTEIEKNDIPTQKMSVFSRIKYCLLYTEYLFIRERKLLDFVGNKADYVNNFGSRIATVVLMKGIRESIKKYFTNRSEEQRNIIELYNSIANEINSYIDSCNEIYQISFERVNLI